MYLLLILLATLTVNAPKQVILGKPFQVTYTVDDRAKDIQAPEFVDFDHLAGPYTSTSSSTSFVNGKRTSTYAQTYTYTLMARREGEFTLGPASVTVGKERILSSGVRITVLPADKQVNNGANSDSGNNGEAANNRASVNNENLFVRTIVSKTRVAEQEAITLTYKLYFAGVDVAQLTNNTKLPEYNGFLKQEIDLGERQTELENYNGRNYQTFTLYQTLLFPQRSGDIAIDPATFEAVLRVQVRQQIRSIFDDFFGSYQNVTRPLQAPGVTIHVEALPSGKPKDFSGAVGQFTMDADISATDVKANEAITIKLNIKGKGNMKLIKTPTVDWPEGLEIYDPKVTNNFKTTSGGVSGSKSIEYLAIPRAGGDYTIPAITFSYYDTAEKTYKTLSTSDYNIHVQRAANEPATVANPGDASYANYVNKEDIRQLGSDIRYISTNENPKAYIRHEINGVVVLLLYLIPLLIAAIILFVMRKHIKAMSDATLVQLKNAKKTAQRHLKAAKKAEGTPEFWEEIERTCRACEPYTDVTDVLSKAEFARYAPSIAGSQDDIWAATAKLVEQLNAIKS